MPGGRDSRDGDATGHVPQRAPLDGQAGRDESRAEEPRPHEPRPDGSGEVGGSGEAGESGEAAESGDEPRHGKHRREPRRQPLWRELLTLVGVALVLTFLIQHFVGRVYSIPSGSMEQTLHGCPGCTGDRVFVDKMVYDFHDPLPGDVVVFQGPNSWTGEEVSIDGSGDNPVLKGLRYLGSLVGVAPPDERDFVKRVIAIGGQTVECCDAEHRVMVDGKALDEPYVHWETGGPDERQRFAPVTVPEGTLWVMGDNRGNSADSRIQGGGGIRGVVPITKVIGKVRAIVLPPSRWQGVGDHNPQAPPAIAAPAWQQGLPAGIGLAAAWPVLWLGRRVKKSLISRKAD
ncbi:signal peptidase I [Actinokineospora sp. 24-640]